MKKEREISILKIAPDMMTRDELSHLIGVSVMTLLSWKDKGTLVPVQCGVVDMYSREQIQCFSGMQVGF